MVFLLLFLLLYARQGGTYSLWIKYFISSPFPLLDKKSKREKEKRMEKKKAYNEKT